MKSQTKFTRSPTLRESFFSPEEDEILQHAIDSENINCKDLAEQLGRTGGSIDTRIRRLKCGGRKFLRRDYSLVEDLLIMVRMLSRLPGKRLEDLEMLVDGTTPDFLTTLGRTMWSNVQLGDSTQTLETSALCWNFEFRHQENVG
jgi:hypothetical protein